MPAMKMSVASPTPLQTSTTATENSASDGSVSQPGPGCRRRARVWLMTPSNGSIRTLNVMPTPIVLTSTGKKMTRADIRGRRCGRQQHGDEQAEHDFEPEVTKPKMKVFMKPCKSTAPGRTGRSCPSR